MSILDQKVKFTDGTYEYGKINGKYVVGGTGLDRGGDGKKDIDCSNLLNQMVKGAG
jgi:hypothetical protein